MSSPSSAVTFIGRNHLIETVRTSARSTRSRVVAGPQTRARARSQWESFIRTRWHVLASWTAIAAAVITGLTLLAPTELLRGAVLGGGVVAVTVALAVGISQMTGTALLSANATAEQWTALELRQLRHDGWRVVNHVAFDNEGGRDIDHVLVGPGGVVVVETKWTSRDWTLSDTWLQNAVTHAELGTRSLQNSGLDELGVPVHSAVFVWSVDTSCGDRAALPTPIADSTLVAGSAAAEVWRQDLLAMNTVLSPEQVQHACRAIAHRRGPASEATQSLMRRYWTGVGILCTAVAAILTNLFVFTDTGASTVWAAVSTTQAALGLFAHRARPLRPFATASLVGLAAVVALAAAVVGTHSMM